MAVTVDGETATQACRRYTRRATGPSSSRPSPGHRPAEVDAELGRVHVVHHAQHGHPSGQHAAG